MEIFCRRAYRTYRIRLERIPRTSRLSGAKCSDNMFKNLSFPKVYFLKIILKFLMNFNSFEWTYFITISLFVYDLFLLPYVFERYSFRFSCVYVNVSESCLVRVLPVFNARVFTVFRSQRRWPFSVKLPKWLMFWKLHISFGGSMPPSIPRSHLDYHLCDAERDILPRLIAPCGCAAVLTRIYVGLMGYNIVFGNFTCTVPHVRYYKFMVLFVR